MAIIEELGIQVRIFCEGTPCPEYEDREQDGNADLDDIPVETPSCHRFVESREDVVFSIEFTILPGGPASRWFRTKDKAICFMTSFDGGPAVTNNAVSPPKLSFTVRGITNSKGTEMRPFRFASISTTDSVGKERLAADIVKAQRLGLIRVEVRRALLLGTLPKQESSKWDAESLKSSNLSISEKALKGKSVSLGATTSDTAIKTLVNFLDLEYMDSPQDPYAVFYLKYRSKDDLQKMMIVPRERVPTSPLGDDNEDDGFANLSREEIERLARERFQEQRRPKRSRSVAIKAEGPESNAQVPAAPKRPYKYTRTNDGKKAIDLTEDDE